MQIDSGRAAVGVAVLVFGQAAAIGQCQPEWCSVGGGAEDGLAEVTALALFDEDGPGPGAPVLFVTGGFSELAGVPLNCLARWDGWEPSQVGEGVGGIKTSMQALGAVSEPAGLVPRGLYVGGSFTQAGPIGVNNLARWDVPAWHDVGGGVTSPNPNLYNFVFSTCVFDEDGDGPMPPAFFVGGKFELAGDVPANGIARWDGQTWSAVGGALSFDNPNNRPSVYSLAVYDDGRGPALYVGGSFYYADGQPAHNIARWDGQSWETLRTGVSAAAQALAVFDEDGDGPARPALFVGGQFSHVDGKDVMRVARWDGQDWSPVGGWLSDGGVHALTVWQAPDDDRANLYMGGFFNILPDMTPIKGIARWNGQVWREVDYGVSGFGQASVVYALAPFDEDGDGPNPGGLYVGGTFLYAGDVFTPHIARWGCPLGPPCEADLDGNGTLDLFDFLAFTNLFNAHDPGADWDKNGAFDLFDFLGFVNAFNAGC